ncbi:CrcB family protein [Inediibacterium massiliense]|nr:CrcB family protein [Inediibacterium massiliense]
MKKEKSSDLKKNDQKALLNVIIAGLIGAILGIVAYTNNWLG